MATLSSKSSSGTSFHDTVFVCSVEDLIQMLGAPQYADNTGEDKVNFDWTCETLKGEVFTIYDWKEYRPISRTELIEWHIGGLNRIVTERALTELTSKLSKLKR